MPSKDYKRYIDSIVEYARQNDIQIMFDLHGAPGGQSGESNTGCSLKHGRKEGFYWDTDWNKTWTKNAFRALA